MSGDFATRRASAADTDLCFRLFRRSLDDLLRRSGFPDRPPLPDPDPRWAAFERLFGHFESSAAEWWIAEDGDGDALGYARSIERSGTVELTEFFVLPGARIGGVGRGLLERAFRPGWGSHRAVIATTDAPAVALYLRFGVRHQSTAIDLVKRPEELDMPSGYRALPAAGAEEILALEREALGHARVEEVEFMLADRPAMLVERGGKLAGYAFLANEFGQAGPIAAADPGDMPVLLACVEAAANASGCDELTLSVPLSATTAISWLLDERSFRVYPFYQLLLADGPWAKFDRYIPFNPTLML